MRRYILIPDSFKGSMTSQEVCDAMAQAIRARDPQAHILSIPVADGGEGSVDCFVHALSGVRIPARAANPYFEEMEAFYGMMPGGLAVIEMAACAGLPLVEDRKNPFKTTTYGVGQLMRHAQDKGAKSLIVGLGGSATNDGGCGAAAACGVRFYDKNGNTFIPTGGTLKDIARIDASGMEISIKDIVVMCDIDNPLCGPSGAAAVFGPQKGATADMVTVLDDGLRHMAGIIERDLSLDVMDVPGAGAAGGMGAGMLAFFNARMQMGIETVLDTVGFDEAVKDADIVFTGEGKIDTQSLRGKVVLGVSRRAKRHGIPVVALVGEISDGIDAAYTQGLTSVFSINRAPMPLAQARLLSRENLCIAMDNILRLMLSNKA